MKIDEEASDAVRNFITSLCNIHHKNILQARVMLISAFTAGYSMFCPQDRLLILQTLLLLAKEIGIEVFEDGQDLISLLTEKTEYMSANREKDEK